VSTAFNPKMFHRPLEAGPSNGKGAAARFSEELTSVFATGCADRLVVGKPPSTAAGPQGWRTGCLALWCCTATHAAARKGRCKRGLGWMEVEGSGNTWLVGTACLAVCGDFAAF
jgi:hypothetical protein